MADIAHIDTSRLKPHERVSISRAIALLLHMYFFRVFPAPILIDRESHTILDGHHRHWAARMLGVKKIPCVVVEYLSDSTVQVETRRPTITVDKALILNRSRSGELFPQKTTRHIYILPEVSRSDLVFIYD